MGGSLRLSESYGDRECASLEDKEIVQSLLPLRRIISLSKTHVEPLNKQSNDDTHLQHRERLPNTVGGSVRERYESSCVVDEGLVGFFPYLFCITEPSIRPEGVGSRGEVTRIALNGVRRYCNGGVIGYEPE